MPSDLVVVVTCSSEAEAWVAQASLHAVGIDSILLRHDAMGMIPSLSFLKGVRVAVRADEADAAREQLRV